jgi:hypothetical protein
LLLSLVVVPGIQDFEPMDVLWDEGLVATEHKIGEGEELRPGRSARIDYELRDGLGRVLLSSEVRGQVMSYVPSGGDSVLEQLLFGMREGGERTGYYPADRFPAGFGGLVPPSTDLVLRVRALSARD